MGRKLYVGNLPFTATQESLKAVFADFGIIESVNLVTDHYSGESKGFAFVEMSSHAEAARAMQGLNGTSLDGRNITVNEAKPKGSGRGRGRR